MRLALTIRTHSIVALKRGRSLPPVLLGKPKEIIYNSMDESSLFERDAKDPMNQRFY